MKSLELSIKKIALLGKQNEKENIAFRSFLKGQNSDNVDKIVHRLYKEIIERIDCADCGNCCKTLRPCLTDEEIDRLSRLENVSREEYITRFVEIDDIEDIKYLKDSPCKYLNDAKCTILPNRPADCKSYPHIHKQHITSRTFGIIENYEICPIVFNVFEQLKIELQFKK